jgi:hypothetical protein
MEPQRTTRKPKGRGGVEMGVIIAIGVAMGVAFGAAFGVAVGALLTFTNNKNN